MIGPRRQALIWLVCSLLLVLLLSLAVWAIPAGVTRGIVIGSLVLALSLAASAIVLRAACYLCRAAIPGFGKAMMVELMAGVLAGLVWGLIALCAGGGLWPPDNVEKEVLDRAALVSVLVFLPCVIFIPAGIYVPSLHVGFGKGLLIRLTEIAITGAFSAVIMGSVWLTFRVTEAARNQIAASQRKSPAEEAAEAERVALELRTKAVNFSERGNELAQAGRAEEAEDAFLNAISHWQRLAAGSPREPEFRQEQARAQVGLGEVYSRTGHHKDAQAAYQEAIALWKDLAAEFPAKPDYVRELARSQLGLGEVLLLSGGAQEAQPAFRDALMRSEKLAVSSPGERHYRRDLARSYSDLGSAVAETGQAKEAEGELTKALDLWRQLVADFPGEADTGTSWPGVS